MHPKSVLILVYVNCNVFSSSSLMMVCKSVSLGQRTCDNLAFSWALCSPDLTFWSCLWLCGGPCGAELLTLASIHSFVCELSSFLFLWNRCSRCAVGVDEFSSSWLIQRFSSSGLSTIFVRLSVFFSSSNRHSLRSTFFFICLLLLYLVSMCNEFLDLTMTITLQQLLLFVSSAARAA